MKRFDNTISKLKSDPFHMIKVVQLPQKKVVANNITAQQMIENYGSVEDYFEDLNNKGITSVQIIDRRKNGSGFMPQGEPYTLNMVSKVENTEALNAPVVNVEKNNIPKPIEMPLGLTGGMNGADFYKAMDYPKLETRNQVLEVENANLKNKVEELKEKILQDQFSKDKTTANNEMLLGLAPLIAPIVERLFPAKTVTDAIGLTGASTTKQEVLRIINAIDEDSAYYIGLTAKNIQNQAFQDELFALLDRYTMQKVV